MRVGYASTAADPRRSELEGHDVSGLFPAPIAGAGLQIHRETVKLLSASPTEFGYRFGMLATATQIKIESVKGFFLFGIYLYRIQKQLAGFPGLVSLAYSPRFQTLSVWENEQAMKAFRSSGAHLEAMKATRKIGRAKVVTWTVTEAPSWREANERLAELAR